MKKTLTIFGTLEVGSSRIGNGKESPLSIGGNGLLASLAASKYGNVSLVGLIGSDINKEKFVKRLPQTIDTENIEQYIGKSFRYKAIYDNSYNLHDEYIDFGVYKNYRPKILFQKIKHTNYIFFSGSNPKYCLEVLSQLDGKQIIGFQTLYYHLKHNYPFVEELIQQTNILFTNKKEYIFLQKQMGNVFSKTKKLNYIFVTNNEKGVEIISGEKTFTFPITKPIIPLDPTNAGDVFAGSIMGMVANGYSLEKDLEVIIEKAQQEARNVIRNDSFYRIPAKPFLHKTILEEIIVQKRKEIALLKRKTLKRKTKIRDFYNAINNTKKFNIIGEIKKASPSAGLLQKDFFPLKIAKTYEKSSHIQAISVLTDEKYFQGSLSLIRKIKVVTKLPILRKDFIIDEKQIYESFTAEADAVLLIVKILSLNKLKHLIQLTEKLGMHVLVEVHSEREVHKAIQAGAKIIGINARNLDDFSIDKKLFAKLKKHIPNNITVVAESGIEKPKDIQQIYEQGASASLIGTAFMKQGNLLKQLKKFEEVLCLK